MKYLSAFAVALFAAAGACGGTIVFKDGETLANIKILSINKGLVVIEKDKGKHTVALSKIVEYYDSDAKNAGSDDFPDNTADYSVTVMKVDISKTGKKSDNKKTAAEMEVEYNILKKNASATSQNVRMPYFYIYVLTEGDKEYGGRGILRYCYPKEAKIKAKNYDRAQIMDQVKNIGRKIIYQDTRLSTGSKYESLGGYRKFNIELKGLNGRKVMAYHLEIWGKSDIVLEKDWSEIGIHAGKNWWQEY